jgi:hypothetical protein
LELFNKILLIGALALVALAASADGDKDRDERCWQVVAAKNRLVFANTCNLSAFQMKVKDIPHLTTQE